jgi:hypothetical protein
MEALTGCLRSKKECQDQGLCFETGTQQPSRRPSWPGESCYCFVLVATDCSQGASTRDPRLSRNNHLVLVGLKNVFLVGWMLLRVLLSSAYISRSRSLMSSSVQTSTRYYAVISVRTDPDRERLVVAYPDEKSLREFIAAPSILALGYRSPAEAGAFMDVVDPKTCVLPQEPKTVLRGAAAQSLTGFPAFHPASEARLALANTRTTLRRLVGHCLAAAIVFVYSKNLLSAMLRAFVSF